MCVQAKDTGFAFECGYYGEFIDIEEAIIQEEEDNQEVNVEINEEDGMSKLMNVLSISLFYSFICESTVRITEKKYSYAIILHTLIYGMIITVNQCHNRHTKYYWVFAFIICIVAPYHISMLVFVIPFVVENCFKSDNVIVSFLEDKYGKLWGNHVYWCFVSWFWFMGMNLLFVYLGMDNNYFIIE
jgi:hypothetical protein